MEELDGDNVRVSSRGRVAERDIVQVWKILDQRPHRQRVHRHKKVADVLFHAHNHICQEKTDHGNLRCSHLSSAFESLATLLSDAGKHLITPRWLHLHKWVQNVREMVPKTLFSTMSALELWEDVGVELQCCPLALTINGRWVVGQNELIVCWFRRPHNNVGWLYLCITADL